MNKTLQKTIVSVIALLLVSGCSGYQINWPGGSGSGNGNSGNTPAQANKPNSTSISAAFARELAIANSLTGLASLPPGIQRRLENGKPLPPGIGRKLLPSAMLSELPSYSDKEWVAIGTDLVLITIGTLIVSEILKDVFE